MLRFIITLFLIRAPFPFLHAFRILRNDAFLRGNHLQRSFGPQLPTNNPSLTLSVSISTFSVLFFFPLPLLLFLSYRLSIFSLFRSLLSSCFLLFFHSFFLLRTHPPFLTYLLSVHPFLFSFFLTSFSLLSTSLLFFNHPRSVTLLSFYFFILLFPIVLFPSIT